MDDATPAPKQCRLCGCLLPLSEFYRDRQNRTGYRNDCKACCIEREQRRAHSAICSRCGKRRQPDDTAHKRYCGDCWRDYLRVYMRGHRKRPETQEKRDTLQRRYRSDPDHQRIARERTRAWRLTNPERRSNQARTRYALKKAGTAMHIPMELLDAKLAYWGWRCWIASPVCTVEPEHWDHVKPLTKGGRHILANLRPACAPCNAVKSNRWPYPTSPVVRCNALPSCLLWHTPRSGDGQGAGPLTDQRS